MGPAILIARENVRAASLEARVEIRRQDVVALADDLGFDRIWFAGPFIPAAAQPPALARRVATMRPGGWLVYGAYGGSDPLTAALSDLRTLRSGGPVLASDDIISMLRNAGLTDVQEAAVPVGLPARLVVGRAA